VLPPKMMRPRGSFGVLAKRSPTDESVEDIAGIGAVYDPRRAGIRVQLAAGALKSRTCSPTERCTYTSFVKAD